MNKIIAASCLAIAVSAFAQGFGGQQSGNDKMEYSEKFTDVNYAGDGKGFHNMDIYLPKEKKDSYPVVIHTYGSAWSMNNYKGSADLNTICAALLKAGYAVVTPNHRSASDAIYPAQLHDLKAVLRFVRGNAEKYKFDTSFVAMSGFSSGGHLSSLVATTCGMTEGKSGSVTVDLVGTVGEFTSFGTCIDALSMWSAPTDIYTMNPIKNFMGSGTYEGAFIGAEREGNKDKWNVASSPYYVSDDDPPVILFHGTSDKTVNIEQSEEMYDSLQRHGVESEFVRVSGGDHGSANMYTDETLGKMVAFFDKAREAKATAAVVTPPDTSAQDTAKTDTVPPGIVYDTLPDALPVLRSLGAVPVTYDVFSLDGTLVSRSSVLNKDALRPGVYYVVTRTAAGRRDVSRFVKK
jgi:acetyl esterase/lipase